MSIANYLSARASGTIDPFDVWEKAEAEPIGLMLETNSGEALRAQLYASRKKWENPLWDDFVIKVLPPAAEGQPQRLALVRKEKLEEARAMPTLSVGLLGEI